MSQSNPPTPNAKIVFREQYVKSLSSNAFIPWSQEAMTGTIDDIDYFFDYDDEPCGIPFMASTFGNWSDEAPSKLEDFMPQNNDPIDSHDYIELEFHTKIYPIRISIFERSVPGTVVRVWAWDELTNYWQKLWSGPPQSDGQDPRIFTPPLAICKFKTNIIRLELNYSLAAYKTLLVGAFLLGTKDLFLPKDDIKDHRLINVIPTRDDDAECTFPEEKRDKLNLTRHVYNAKSFYSDLNNIKRIIRQNYVIWTFNDQDDSSNSSSSSVEIADTINQKSLNNLADETLLEILGYLDFKSLVRCSETNKRINRISRDKKLHRSLNLKPYWDFIDDRTLSYLMERCSRLKRIDLSWCGYTKISSQMFISFLRKCGQGLTHLRLNAADFVIHEVIKEIAKNCPHLKELCLRTCKSLKKDEFGFLENLKFLECLDLHNTCILAEQLSAIIRNNRGLKHLNLGAFSNITIDEVVLVISESCPHIEILNLYDQVGLTDTGINYLSRCTNLRELDISNCCGVTYGGDPLDKLLKNCRVLEKFFGCHMAFLPDGIVESVLQCKKVKQLDISYCQIYMALVSQILGSLPELRLLILSLSDEIDEAVVQNWREIHRRVTIKYHYEFCDT